MPFIFWKTACFHRITKKSCLKNGRKKKSGNLLKRSVQLFGMISAIFLFRNRRNIHSIRYLLWTAGWGERTYGGKRGHEGCDLMASKDIPGLYPVVSMTDGVVSARGWLEKGGYRIGITAPSGAYFYYAHLDSYGSYQEGDEVKAGDIIGFMGNTGYDPEGMKGMFATHLHLGIYLYPDGKETSYNPYWILRLAGGEKTFLFFLTMLYLNDMEDERMINLPNEFEEKMKALLGDEFEDYIKCYDEPRYYGLRVNTEKISVEDFVKICPFEITPIPWIDNGFTMTERRYLLRSIRIILQDFITCRSRVQ